MKIEILRNEQFGNIRVQHVDGVAWFNGKDACKALDLSNVSHATSEIEPCDKGIILNDTLGGKQKMIHVNESGLYELILQSRKHEAKLFLRWITREVLPAIRKTGKYAISEDTPQTVQATIDMNAATLLMYEIATLDDEAKRKKLAFCAQKAICSVTTKKIESYEN